MAGAAATNAEHAKRRKYEDINKSFIFVPFDVETLGPWGPDAHTFFNELARRLVERTRDLRAGSYLSQRISLAIQWGNAASILGTLPHCNGIDGFDLMPRESETKPNISFYEYDKIQK